MDKTRYFTEEEKRELANAFCSLLTNRMVVGREEALENKKRLRKIKEEKNDT